MLKAAAECQPTEKTEVIGCKTGTCWTSIKLCDKFLPVSCSLFFMNYGWEKMYFKVCYESQTINKMLTWNFVSSTGIMKFWCFWFQVFNFHRRWNLSLDSCKPETKFQHSEWKSPSFPLWKRCQSNSNIKEDDGVLTSSKPASLRLGIETQRKQPEGNKKSVEVDP